MWRWAVALMLGGAVAPALAEIQGAGATFPSKVYERWAQTFQKSHAIGVRYRPTGSGDGVRQITDRAVQFGGTDSPLPPAELAKRQLVQIPMLVGGVVPVVNLPGIENGRLRLDGELLADLMAGRVAKWNDARIAALNRGLTLPALPVRRVVRAEKSGTTEGFARYLSQVSAPFKSEVGVSQLPAWPGEVMRADGNDGVSKSVKATPGAIGYVSFDRVVQDGLAGVRLRNAAGEYVVASEEGFRAAVVESDVNQKGDDLASILDRPGVRAWPITLASFVLVDAAPAKAGDTSSALRFLYWCFVHGDALTRGTGFAPLPTTVQSKLASRFASVKAGDGKPMDYVGM
ncbi:MAG TPA: phosphate ABC transporter substrate-binding protein PstS [Albitalea sp.]|uniref:phosphate ABC transporter substrate-binding protein PstS n=1 Tax=Piscinibacter sp. TaxID=1903157 RepID=UPI002ED122EF